MSRYIHIYHIYTHIYNIHIQPYCSALKKKDIFSVCSNMDELGGHYTKWNKSGMIRNNLWSHLHVQSKSQTQRSREYDGCCQGLRGGEKRGVMAIGYKVSILYDK